MEENKNDAIEHFYAKHWSEIIEPGGELDMDQVKKELYDYRRMMHEVCMVYMHITNSRISKPNTMAHEVIGVADTIVEEHTLEAIEDALKEKKWFPPYLAYDEGGSGVSFHYPNLVESAGSFQIKEGETARDIQSRLFVHLAHLYGAKIAEELLESAEIETMEGRHYWRVSFALYTKRTEIEPYNGKER